MLNNKSIIKQLKIYYSDIDQKVTLKFLINENRKRIYSQL